MTRETAARQPAKVLVLIAVAVLWVAFAATAATPHALVSDEVFYQAMLDALTRQGTLFLENGYDEFPSPSLLVRYLIPTEAGLAPQYPSGYAVLAAPAYLIAGARGLIVLNAVAAAATLGLVYGFAERLTRDRDLALDAALIFGLATFVVDVAIGIWPHGLAMFFVVAALAAAAAGWRAERPAAGHGWLALAGLAVGLGVNMRVDSILVLPAILFWLLALHPRPYRAAALVIAGLLPPLVFAAALNEAKFGTFNPFTYGHQEGGGSTDVEAYRPLLPIALAAIAAALLLGLAPVRRVMRRPLAIVAAVVAIAAVVTTLSPLRELAVSMLEGFAMLALNFELFRIDDYGVEVLADESVRVHGFIKKALLQSLPYAGALVLVLAAALRGWRLAAISLCLLALAIWTAPFALKHWHGNSGTTMRYFLPMLAPLAVLAAIAWKEIGPGRNWRIALAAVAGTLIVWIGLETGDGHALPYLLQVPLADVVAVTLLALSLALIGFDRIGSRHRDAIASAVRGVFVLGLVVAFVSAYVFDILATQSVRAAFRQAAAATEELPAESLLFSYTPAFSDVRFNRPPRMTVRANTYDIRIDPDLVAYAFESGRRVFAQDRHLAEAILATGAAADLVVLDKTRNLELIELLPPAGTE